LERLDNPTASLLIHGSQNPIHDAQRRANRRTVLQILAQLLLRELVVDFLRPARVPCECAVHHGMEAAEAVRVNKEGGDEVDLPCEVGMLDELSGPAVDSGAVSEVAVFPGKSGDEGAVVVHELGWAGQVGFDDIAESLGVCG
jgi:hypothetical protein